jgi:hypothetical protein
MCEAKWQWHLLEVKMNTILIFSLVILLFGVDVDLHQQSN